MNLAHEIEVFLPPPFVYLSDIHIIIFIIILDNNLNELKKSTN